MAKYRYLDQNDTNPKPIHAAFTQEEMRRIFLVAEWFAAVCLKHGQPIPPDPLRALLGAAEVMAQELNYLDAINENEHRQENGGVAH